MQIDVTQRIAATEREVRSVDGPDGPQDVIVLRRTSDPHPADLWEAMTDPERLPRWFLPVTGDLQVGGRFQLEGNAGGEILVCDEPTHLAVTWEHGGEISWVDVRLAHDGDRTRFELQHRADAGGEHWDLFGAGAGGIGWDLGLLGLVLHLETSAPVDPAEFGAWTTSDEGRSYIEAAAEAWERAERASGVPEQLARRRAQATIDAYTGSGEHPDHPEG